MRITGKPQTLLSSINQLPIKMSTKLLRKLFFIAICLCILSIIAKMTAELAQRSSCIFCNIVNHLENTEILYEDEDVAVFRDIKPASRFHVLTVPKRHIEDVKALTPQDKDLVIKMYAVAKEMIVKNNLSVEDARFGYHWPPFRSVHHLHLHAIAPESEMGFIARAVFMKKSYWFVSPEYVINML